MTKPEERTKFKQARFEQWLSQQRRELKAGEADKVLDELERLRLLMQEAQAASAGETITKKLNYLNERRAMLALPPFKPKAIPLAVGAWRAPTNWSYKAA